jgi:hypothetical protein
MPKYVVTDPKTGKKLTLTGDSPPSEAELEEVFSQVSAPAAPAEATGPAARRFSLTEMGFPATTAHAAANGNDMSLGRVGALANDVLSLPKRILDANAQIAGNQGPDEVMAAMTNTKARNPVDAIGREAPLMAVPALRLASKGAMRIVSAVGSGMAEAAPSAALHQLEGKSEGQDISLRGAGKEMMAGGVVRGAFETGGQLLRKGIPFVKRGISKLSEVSQDALEAVTHPQAGKQNLEQAATAAKRFGTADGGTDMLPMAEELGQKVDAENAARMAATEKARGAQRLQLEQDALGLRSDRPVQRIPQVSAGDQGSKITDAIEASKAPMQDAWKAGDAAALGELREAPASTRTVQRTEQGIEKKTIGAFEDRRQVKVPFSRTVNEEIPILPGKIADVLTEHKALSPEQGVPKITRGAAGAIKTLMGMAQNQGKSIDDLINLKGQLRSMQASGGHAGEIFDASTDDRAFGQVAGAIDQAIEESIGKAVKDKGQAETIIGAFRANQTKYARLKDALGDLSKKLGQVQNNANIVSKVKAMGPEKAVELIQEASRNAPLKPVVEELRKGFVDDLLLSSVKEGEFDPQRFASEWKSLDADVKKAWLTAEQIKSLDKAVAKGTEEIKDPQKVGGALFGGMHGMGEHSDIYGGDKKLSNITSAAQKKALAELQALDAIFGTEYTKDAVAAYRSKQLQMGETGRLPGMGNIRTGKAYAAAASGASVGGSVGAAVAGPPGAAVGSLLGTGAGFFAQSPAGAVLMFRALNRLERAGASDATKAAVSQGLRSATFQPKAQRIAP